MVVKDIMCRDVTCCTPDTKLQDVAKMMINCDCGSIPVIADQKSRRLMGIVTDRDIVCRVIAQGKNPLDFYARDCMSTNVTCVTPDTDLDKCCAIMEERQVRRVPVLDATDRCCGIVSQADIARRAPQREAAEVVKEVSEPARASAGRRP